MIWLMVTEWVGPRLYKLAGAGVVVALGMGACMVRDASIENRGVRKTVAKIEKATENAAKIGKRAAAGSATPGVRGQRDPSTRDD